MHGEWRKMAAPSISTRFLARMRQALRAILACLIVLASLLVFPNVVPWLIAAWLLAYTLLILFGRRGTACLAACLAILAVKRLTPAPGLLVLMVVMATLIVVDVWRSRRTPGIPSRHFAWGRVLLLWMAWTGATVDWYAAMHCRHRVMLRGDRPVACFGDSMTSLGLMGGYPDDLRPLISLPVVNAGISGISAKQAVEKHLPQLLRHNPQVVVIELGGHDYLRGHGRAATKANLLAIIDACRKIDAEVVLMEIPRSFISDPFWGLEREIARQEDVELIPDTAMRTLFLRSPLYPPGSWLGEPYLTDETGIHANARGQKILARSVANTLERMYGPQIRRMSSP